MGGMPVEERILQLLQHLGIDQAHFAARTPGDWTGLTTRYPQRLYSFTLVGPGTFPPETVRSLASRLLVFTGDQEGSAERVRHVMENLPNARHVAFRDYALLGWNDVIADYRDEIASTMLPFLAEHSPESATAVPHAEAQGEICLLYTSP